MRLCWNDGFQGPLGDARVDEARFYRSIGYRVCGINAGVVEASDADIAHILGIFDDNGLYPGPYGFGGSAVHPDPEQEQRYLDRIRRALKLAGKLGCTNIRYSVGSLHPDNVWMHHPDNVTQWAMDRLVENTRSLIPHAGEADCILCPETTQWTIVNGIGRMKEFVDRCDSPYVRVAFDPVNHMTSDRVYDSGRWMKCAVAHLGDRIGEFHVKDVMVQDALLVVHIDEAPMGEGLLDHAALMEASRQLEPWKTFSLEHISVNDRPALASATKHILETAASIGHEWTDPACDRRRFRENGCG